MSHIASFLYFNALFEASFLRTEHLTASEKYKFSRQKDIIHEFYEVKLVSKSLICDAGTQALRHKMLSEVSYAASQHSTRYWNLRKLSQCYALLTEFSSKTRKCLVRNAGTRGNSLSASDGTLERVEIRCQQATERWNERKFVHSVRQGTGTGGNSLPAFNEVLERAEICSQRSTGHWNWRKFVASVQRGTGTCGNLFTTIDRVLEPAEIVAVLRTAYVANQRFAYRVFFENSQMFGAACRNERKLSQYYALLTSQIKDLLTEFLLYKQPPQRTARKIE